MAYTETPAEKAKRKAWEQANLDTARAKEAKADTEIARKFEETTNVDTSKNTNPMGDTYKKGGKVKSKVSSASKRGDGCCVKGKTRGRMV